jgi:putative thioredoxin
MAESPYIHTVTLENFESNVIQESHSRPVLVDFWAGWCNPCQMLMPILAGLADEYQGRFLLAKVDTEDQRELAAQVGIRSLPTVQLFKDGQLVDQFMGALPEAEIRAFLEQHVGRESDKALREAQSLLEQGDVEAAQQLINSAEASDPDNPRVRLGLANLQAAQGHFDEAAAILDELPADLQEDEGVKALRSRMRFETLVHDAPPVDELEAMIAADPANSRARHQLATRRAAEGDYEAALDHLLTLMRKDRGYGGDAARKDMLALFDMLGAEHELVARYRSRMFNALH